jgi:peptide/nickel transport system ATP-binding protein
MLMRGLSADPNEGAGRVVFDDWGRKIDVMMLDGEDLNSFRRKLQFIFQDPFGSLNPRMTVYDILVEPLIIHGIGDDSYRREMVGELMELVGLDRRQLSRYPHSFSGGQRQRIGIARSLALRPDMVICDEPVSALDVSIQAQILNLLKDLQKQLGLTYLFISHNLAVIEHVASRIAVMYLGRIVETADRDTLFRNPRHPYTKALLASVLTPDPALGVPDTGLGLAFPDPLAPPPGCVFHPRCPQAGPRCRVTPPPIVRDGHSFVACHLYGRGTTSIE